MDDDCDGQTDEFDLGAACMVTLGGCDAMGMIVCNPGNNTLTQCFVENEPIRMAEQCNGLDDDCDGEVDENFPELCRACIPAMETCNQMDDDCDGSIDENLAWKRLNSVMVRTMIVTVRSTRGQRARPNGQPSGQDLPLLRVDCAGTAGRFGRRNEWQASKSLCESIGFHLVKVDNRAEDAFVYRTLSGLGYGDTWMGMNDLQSDMNWVWHDGSGLGYANWDDGEPNGERSENCGIMLVEQANRASRWDDRPCDRDYHFVCEPAAVGP